MEKLLIDTNVISRYLKSGEGILADIIDNGYELMITPTVITELKTASKANNETTAKQIDEFIAANFQVITIDKAVGEKAGEILRSLEITLASAYQAAAALKHDIPLLSYDIKTFDQVPDLKLIDI